MHKLIRILIIVLCVALLAGMTGIIINYRRAANARAAHIAELSAEAKPLEQELTQLRREQETQELQVYEPAEPGCAVIAFRIRNEDTYTKAWEYGADYGFIPMILVNVDDAALDEGILPALEESGASVIFSCGAYTDDTIAQLRSVQERLDEIGCVNTHAFVLRSSADSSEHRAELFRTGITTLFMYGDVVSGGVAEDGTVVLNYSYVSKNSYSAGSRLSDLSNSEQALVFAIDLQSGDLTDAQIRSILTDICEEEDRGHIVIGSVEDAVRVVKNRVQRESELLTEFLTASEAREARIAELEKTIRDIYSHWSDG